jgi:hypothetical protein
VTFPGFPEVASINAELLCMSGNKKKICTNRNNRNKKRIALLFLIVGAIGWFIPYSNIFNYQWLELPNSLPQGLCVDNSENILCGSQTYERIQMYDKNGGFVRGFSTDVGKGSGFHFTFEVKNRQLHIHVYGAWLKSERFDREIVYALDGSLLKATDIPSTEYVGYNVNNKVHDSFGNYYIFKGYLFPRIIKKTDKRNAVIISTPIYFWLFQSPFPAFAFFFISLLVLVGFKNIIKPQTNKGV